MAEWMEQALVLVGAYAIGCANGAYYLVRFRTRKDLRAVGSGNAGARNAGRVLGRAGFITAFVIDAAKGIGVVLGAQALGMSDATVTLAMAAVIAGHVWPLQLRFKGGKGASTVIGALAVYNLVVLATILAVGLLMIAATRRMMVGAFVALVTAPVAASIYGHDIAAVAGLAIVALVVVLAHRVDVSVGVDVVDAKLHEVPGSYAS